MLVEQPHLILTCCQTYVCCYDNRYSYQVLEEAERRRVNPTPSQQKIMSLLMEKQDETAFQNNRSQRL